MTKLQVLTKITKVWTSLDPGIGSAAIAIIEEASKLGYQNFNAWFAFVDPMGPDETIQVDIWKDVAKPLDCLEFSLDRHGIAYSHYENDQLVDSAEELSLYEATDKL